MKPDEVQLGQKVMVPSLVTHEPMYVHSFTPGGTVRLSKWRGDVPTYELNVGHVHAWTAHNLLVLE